MELPKIGSGGGVFDGIKSKLGFTRNDSYDDDYDESYYDDTNYAEYEEDYGAGYNARYADDDSYGGSVSAVRRAEGSPRLVSIDDVRSRTQIPDSLNRDPLPERKVSSAQKNSTHSSGNGYRSTYSRKVERAADYMKSTNSSDAPLQSSTRSSGYESLFSSTTPSQSGNTESAVVASADAQAYDPYEAYAGSGISSHNPSRALSLLKPMSYGEVERIAKTIKAGDVVILCLNNTPDQLSKRILDFSFGVSSALDASVECISDKVFAIASGRSLSEEEKNTLHSQGVI